MRSCHKMKFLVTNSNNAMLMESNQLQKAKHLAHTSVYLEGNVKTFEFCVIETQWKNMFFIFNFRVQNISFTQNHDTPGKHRCYILRIVVFLCLQTSLRQSNTPFSKPITSQHSFYSFPTEQHHG